MNASATITCTICGALIPLTLTTAPTLGGLSATFDQTLVDEHIEMHNHCGCGWSDTGARLHFEGCPVHGLFT